MEAYRSHESSLTIRRRMKWSKNVASKHTAARCQYATYIVSDAAIRCHHCNGIYRVPESSVATMVSAVWHDFIGFSCSATMRNLWSEKGLLLHTWCHCLCCALPQVEAPGLLDKGTMLGYNVRLHQGADSAPWCTSYHVWPKSSFGLSLLIWSSGQVLDWSTKFVTIMPMCWSINFILPLSVYFPQ